jgi:hypothetical protein
MTKKDKEEKAKFAVGDIVKTKRSHDKATSVLGEVIKIHEDADVLDIELANGTAETAHFDDATLATAAEEKQLKDELEKAKRETKDNEDKKKASRGSKHSAAE